jgi:predicted nucleic acid-binding protein
LARQIYLDTNFVIRFIESADESLLRVIEDASADLLDLFTSELTLTEVLVGPLKANDNALAEYYEEFLISDDILQVVPIDRVVLREAARIRAEVGARTPDAIHCATAICTSCSIFLSSDLRLRMPAGLTRVTLERIADDL